MTRAQARRRDLLNRLWEQAGQPRRSTLAPGVSIRPYLDRVLRLCLLLQDEAGAEPFPLSTAEVARLMGLDAWGAGWAVLIDLANAGVLERQSGPTGPGRPSRYRVVGARWADRPHDQGPRLAASTRPARCPHCGGPKASETLLAKLWGLASREVAQWAGDLPYHPDSRLASVAALCRILASKEKPGEPFRLDERSLALVMGVENKNLARYALKALEADQVIRCTERGRTGHASRYALCSPLPAANTGAAALPRPDSNEADPDKVSSARLEALWEQARACCRPFTPAHPLHLNHPTMPTLIRFLILRQEIAGRINDFPLARDVLAGLAATDPRVASRWLTRLCHDGVLRVARRPNRRAGLCTRYQCLARWADEAAA